MLARKARRSLPDQQMPVAWINVGHEAGSDAVTAGFCRRGAESYSSARTLETLRLSQTWVISETNQVQLRFLGNTRALVCDNHN